MERSLTVPKGIRFLFEQVAYDLCERARLDYPEVPQKVSEFVGYMENRWRGHIEGNFVTNEAAAERAMEDFGDVEISAKIHRGGIKGLWHRLVYYRRYSVNRLLSIVSIGSLHYWIIMNHSVEAWVDEEGSINILRNCTPVDQYKTCFGMVGVIFFMKWSFGLLRDIGQDKSQDSLEIQSLYSRYFVANLPLLGQLMATYVVLMTFYRMLIEMAGAYYATFLNLSKIHPDFWKDLICVMLGLLEAPLLPFVFILAMAEIYDFHRLKAAGRCSALFKFLKFSWISRGNFQSSRGR